MRLPVLSDIATTPVGRTAIPNTLLNNAMLPNPSAHEAVVPTPASVNTYPDM